MTNQISIERLATGTRIEITGTGWTGNAEVMECKFDGCGYLITFCTNDRHSWDAVDHIYVDAGGSVECGEINDPRWTRSDAEISFHEWQAKTVALVEAHADQLASMPREVA